MFCTQCGTQIDNSSRFCSNCGKPTSPDVAPAHDFAVPPPPLPFAEPPAAAYETKKLRRIMSEKKIAGVCAGYAEYFGIDITLMRLSWVGLLLIPPNIGIIAYFVSWAVLPKEQ